MRILKDFWPSFVTLVLFVAIFATLQCQRDSAIRRYQAAETVIEQHDSVIQMMTDDYKLRGLELLWEIKKLEDAYRYLERESLAEIKRLMDGIQSGVLIPTTPNQSELPDYPFEDATPYMETDDGQHNQSEARTRIQDTERPDRLSEDTRMGCGGNARERFSTRHPRFVPLQKRVRRKMGRR